MTERRLKKLLHIAHSEARWRSFSNPGKVITLLEGRKTLDTIEPKFVDVAIKKRPSPSSQMSSKETARCLEHVFHARMQFCNHSQSMLRVYRRQNGGPCTEFEIKEPSFSNWPLSSLIRDQREWTIFTIPNAWEPQTSRRASLQIVQKVAARNCRWLCIVSGECKRSNQRGLFCNSCFITWVGRIRFAKSRILLTTFRNRAQLNERPRSDCNDKKYAHGVLPFVKKVRSDWSSSC